MPCMKAAAVGMVAALLAWGCMSAGEHRAAVQGEGEQLTVGKVQREIRVGMPGSEVVRVLGTPNIVTTDEERREVWVYDRVATETVYSESRGGVLALVLLGGGGIGAGAAPAYGSSAGARSSTQRTLTVVVKFDAERRVRDFAYHASQF
jgi:outer membrane protein assembly factor BamE (lipoprotein component of BamABCDE complex)